MQTPTQSRWLDGKIFSKTFFVSKWREKSLNCPGNRSKSHQNHCTSITIHFSAPNIAIYDNLPLFNSQFPPENPWRKTFHVHFKDFPYNIGGCWMWHEDFSRFVYSRRATFPARHTKCFDFDKEAREESHEENRAWSIFTSSNVPHAAPSKCETLKLRFLENFLLAA